MEKKDLFINGIKRVVITDPNTSLITVLRDYLLQTDVKNGCEKGHCGACSVILNGKLTLSCLVKMEKVPEESTILTVEGIGKPGNLHPIQQAFVFHGVAQCGFCTPGFVVSSKALLDTNPDPTRQEIRDWFTRHHNVCRCNGYVPYIDAVIDASAVLRGEKKISDITFQMPKDGKIWGTKYPRPSAEAKVTGTLDYGGDIGLKLPPDTLQLALVQAEVSHANIKEIDTSEAENMPGVFKVVTHKEVKGKNRITVNTLPKNLCDGWDRPILNDTKIFQYGDVIAIVCADTKTHAEEAANKVKVDLEVLPAYMSALEAIADNAIEIHPGTPNIYFEQEIKKGADTSPIMKKAAYTVEGEYYLQRQPHMTVETDVGFAYYDDEGRLTIHSKSIGINEHLSMIAPGLGIEPERLRLVQNPSGASFGYKLSPTNEALLGVACMATGRPVFLRYNYHQHMTYTGKRSPMLMKIKMGADEEGKLLAMEGKWLVDHGPYSEFGDFLTRRVSQFMGSGYDIANIRGMGKTVATNHSWGSAFRAFGSPQAFLASESLIDELAEKMDIDPFELRYKNVYRPGSTTPTGQEPDVTSFVEMFDALRPKYYEAKKKAKEESTPEFRKGVGVSLGIYGCGSEGKDSSEVEAELTKNGVTMYASWEDHGQGADMGLLGTAHTVLLPTGILPSQIKLVMNDTALTPDSGSSAGSRQQVVTGNAIKVACESLMTAMRKPDGSFRTYDEMVAEKIPLRYSGKWKVTKASRVDDNVQGNPFSVYMYGVFMSEVTVDTRTGKTKVNKVTMMADVGNINNKLVVDGQIYGGIAQGVGLALSEDFEDIKKHDNMRGAGIPYANDIPDDIEIHYINTPRPNGIFGAAGTGELPSTSPHVSIINAIANATGVRIRHLPAYPEKVLAGLNAK